MLAILFRSQYVENAYNTTSELKLLTLTLNPQKNMFTNLIVEHIGWLYKLKIGIYYQRTVSITLIDVS